MSAKFKGDAFGRVVRESEHLVLQDDTDTATFRVTCAEGWCFDLPNDRGQDGLHELVADYSRGGKGEALKRARADFNEYLPRVQRCVPNCEVCGAGGDL